MIYTTLSHYKILEKLGSEGMDEIYKAEDIKLERTVALKFHPSSFTSDEESKKRLFHEAQSTSVIEPNSINYLLGKFR
jgi:serine/threonine protein kinase